MVVIANQMHATLWKDYYPNTNILSPLAIYSILDRHQIICYYSNPIISSLAVTRCLRNSDDKNTNQLTCPLIQKRQRQVIFLTWMESALSMSSWRHRLRNWSDLTTLRPWGNFRKSWERRWAQMMRGLSFRRSCWALWSWLSQACAGETHTSFRWRCRRSHE